MVVGQGDGIVVMGVVLVAVVVVADVDDDR